MYMYMLQFYSGYGEAGWGGGVGPMVRAFQDTGLIKRSWFRACWGHYVVFLGRILYLLVQCLTLSRCINGYLHDVWGNTVFEGRDTETGFCFTLMSYLASVECFRTIVRCTVHCLLEMWYVKGITSLFVN